MAFGDTVGALFWEASAGMGLLGCSCSVHHLERASFAALLMEPRPYPWTLMAVFLKRLSSSSDRWTFSSGNSLVPFSPVPLGGMVENGIVTGWLVGGLRYRLIGCGDIGSFEDV